MDEKMENKAIFQFCQDLGCCNLCCLRYLGVKNPKLYENSQNYISKYYEQNEKQTETTSTENGSQNSGSVEDCDNLKCENDENMLPPSKKRRVDTCVSCLGILQEDLWPQCIQMTKEMFEKKCYECVTFACALSAPISTILREKAIILMLCDNFKEYDEGTMIALKEAWKWSFGVTLARSINMSLDSGAVSPLLVTITIEYPNDLQELEILKTLSPKHFEARSRQRRRFAIEFTRRSVEQALETVTLEALRAADGWGEGLPDVSVCVKCVSVISTHAPMYLGGCYQKLSRELPQTPWVVNGKRMMESSVQEIIFEPIAKLYKVTPEDCDYRLKFMSAGREDVDVRCLGGRPFAIEILDPHRKLTSAELEQACEDISKGGKVIVSNIVPVTKEDLTQLKQGEETKCKTYEALCVKLAHTKLDSVNGDKTATVTEEDIENINKYRNTDEDAKARIVLSQKTPIRVLHRRPLLTRCRKILDLNARLVPGHPSLFVVRVRTEAGTYIKEWVHGELGRTQPSLGAALGAPVDILALDVANVDLDWPKIPNK